MAANPSRFDSEVQQYIENIKVIVSYEEEDKEIARVAENTATHSGSLEVPEYIRVIETECQDPQGKRPATVEFYTDGPTAYDARQGRDGEWISEFDDKLFLTKPGFDENVLGWLLWEDHERVNSEEEYRKAY
ncbi:hypothetical protein F4803DRAFT_547337 [Xylaria telfairii]|nr:hypothetical protein F4803DRAFT_547337 [Xylaria telfairii]